MRWSLPALLFALLATAALAATGDGAGAASASPTPTGATGGEPAFESIGLRQGLTSSSIYSILVDRHGFVWFAGDNGVHRYDGQHVHTIDRDPDRPDTLASRTNAAIEQTRDAIWILSFAGVLQRLDAASGTITAFELARSPDGKHPGRGTRMIVDAADRLWIGTDVGLFRFDSTTRTHSTVEVFNAAETRVTALALSADGRSVLVGGVDGRIFSLDPEDPSHPELLLTLAPLENTPVPLVVAPWRRELWIGTTQGLFHFDLGTRRLDRANAPDEIARERVKALAVGRDGVVWFGSEHRMGLYRFDPANGRSSVYRHHPDDPHSLSSDRIDSLAIDTRDNLWVGLIRDGANRLRTSQQGAVGYRAEGATGNSFCAARDLPDGRLLVSLCGGSIAVLDPASGRLEEHAAELDRALARPAPALTSHAIAADDEGGFWLPTNGLGLLRWEPKLARARQYPMQAADGSPLPNPYMNDALMDRRGRLWVACSLGLATLAPDRSALRLLDTTVSPGSLLTGGVLRLDQAADGTLWIGSTQGLVHYDPDSGSAERYRHAAGDTTSLSDDLVLSTHVDPDATLWVGTQAGLNRMVADASGRISFHRYGVADGLPDQTIDSIVGDARGALWVGTNRGIASLDPQRDRFRAFAPADGVPDSTVNWRAGLAAPDGSVYFGTFSGLLRLFPERLRATEPQPLMLSSYEIGGSTRINLRGAEVGPLATSYTTARVRFNVAAFGDHRPLSYRLLGLESQWQNMPAGLSIGYDPLPPGDYRFEVRQMSRDGDWQAPALSLPLSVAPPPWRTPLAYALYVVAALAALIAVASAYRGKLERERRHVRQLHHVANYDALTGLPNRARFSEDLAAAMVEAAPLALLFIDLDRFKNINDSLGHRFGDQVLIAATRRFREALPASVQLARLGGDEFTVVLPRLHHEREAAIVAQALLDAFATPLRVDGSDVVVTLSIGISLAPAHANDAATLIQYADSAMYVAKGAGRNAHRFFQPEMVAQVSRRLALETSLRHALDNGELSAVYQAQFEISTGRVSGAEALMRWHSGEHGEVTPAEFIPILEDTGMIEPVGLWMVELVCEQARRWRATELPPLCVAVNVSVHQLIRGELCDRLAQLLSSLALPRHALEIEVTESALMENAQRMGTALHELRSLGLALAIDDFGTGYSSFAYLSHLPVDKLKIDKAFIDGVGVSESADTLCAAIIAMAHNLKLTVVAEGVETEIQHRRLKAMGCDEAQGYWYCRPLQLDEFEVFLRQHVARPSIA